MWFVYFLLLASALGVLATTPFYTIPWKSHKNLGPYTDAYSIFSSPPLLNCSLPCFNNKKTYMGWDLSYDTCTNGCRTIVCHALPAGDPARVSSSTPLFDGWFKFPNGTAIPYKSFEKDNYPPLYPSLAPHPAIEVFQLTPWMHGADQISPDYPWLFTDASEGVMPVFVDKVQVNDSILQSLAPVYQPLGDELYKLQYWDLLRCVQWAQSLGTTVGHPLHGKVGTKLGPGGHSTGVAYDFLGNARLGLPAVPGVAVLLPVDASLWARSQQDLTTNVPQVGYASSQYAALMNLLRPVALSQNLNVTMVMQYNTAHAQIAAFSQNEGKIALTNALSTSWSAPDGLAPNIVDESDSRGSAQPGNVIKTVTLEEVFEVIVYIRKLGIQAYLLGNRTAFIELQLDRLNVWLGARGFVRAYDLSGSNDWDPNNGNTTATEFEYNDNYSASYGRASVDYEIQNHVPPHPCSHPDRSKCKWQYDLSCVGCKFPHSGLQTARQLFASMIANGRQAKVLQIQHQLTSLGLTW